MSKESREGNWLSGWTLEEIKEHIISLENRVERLQKVEDTYEETFQGWHIIDFYLFARDYYYPDLTKEQCMEVGWYVDKYYDAHFGISYDNMDWFIDMAIEREGWAVERMAFDERPDVTEEDDPHEYPHWSRVK